MSADSEMYVADWNRMVGLQSADVALITRRRWGSRPAGRAFSRRSYPLREPVCPRRYQTAPLEGPIQ